MNKTILSGNLGQDPESRYFESGKNVTTFSLAVSDYGKTEWWLVECWGKSGESAANHLRKGSSVIVEGAAGMQFWNDKTTSEAKGKLVLKNARWEFAGSKKDADDSNSYADEEF